MVDNSRIRKNDEDITEQNLKIYYSDDHIKRADYLAWEKILGP